MARELGADHFVADFTRLGEVRELAAELDAAYPRIDVLANNAGGIFGERTLTADGFELTFQVNHLAPFLLTTALLGKLGVVLQTASSSARRAGPLAVDDLNFARSYDVAAAYSTTKLENVLFARELHRRHHADGISAAAFHPGNIASNFAAGTTSRVHKFIVTNPLTRRALLTTPDQGADTLCWLATSAPGTDWQPGGYYEKRRPATTAAQASDADLARRLWERSEELLASNS